VAFFLEDGVFKWGNSQKKANAMLERLEIFLGAKSRGVFAFDWGSQ
jgi:hypothetical protein